MFSLFRRGAARQVVDAEEAEEEEEDQAPAAPDAYLPDEAPWARAHLIKLRHINVCNLCLHP